MMGLRLKEAQRLKEKKYRGWLSWNGCRLLAQFGRRLVVAGERLERYGMPQMINRFEVEGG
jgi:hypothetical protein